MRESFKLNILILILGLSLVLSGCQEKHTSENEVFFFHQLYAQLDLKATELTAYLTEANFGLNVGQYPEESKSILEDAINEIEAIIQDFIEGNGSLLKYNEAIKSADDAIVAFNATVRTVKQKFVGEKAHIWCNNEGGAKGYIDFGVKEEYNTFGQEEGKREFTIETWLYVSNLEGWSAIIGTYIGGNKRSGWVLNTYDNKYLRCTWAFKREGWPNEGNIIEPRITINNNTDVSGLVPENWVHFAVTYSDITRSMTLYYNGEKNVTANLNELDLCYSAGNDSSPMLAFARVQEFGKVPYEGFTSGSVKDFHMWTSVLPDEQILKLYKQEIIVTGAEKNLLCGWAFDSTVEDSENIPDLTGNYFCKLVGDCFFVND